MIELKDIDVIFNKGTNLENHVLKLLNLKVKKGDFVTVIGGNGAGKSTLMNVLAGDVLPNSGKIMIDKEDVAYKTTENRAIDVARVFQDPMLGTCAELTIEENLALAYKRGQVRGLKLSLNDNLREHFKQVLAELKIGLEDRLKDKVALLSGGQRQILSLVMATLRPCKILLLDEHTAALDPKMSELVLELTNKLYANNKLTILMITHNIKHAFMYGNRTIMMQDGVVTLDLKGEDRSSFDLLSILSVY